MSSASPSQIYRYETYLGPYLYCVKKPYLFWDPGLARVIFTIQNTVSVKF